MAVSTDVYIIGRHSFSIAYAKSCSPSFPTIKTSGGSTGASSAICLDPGCGVYKVLPPCPHSVRSKYFIATSTVLSSMRKTVKKLLHIGRANSGSPTPRSTSRGRSPHVPDNGPSKVEVVADIVKTFLKITKEVADVCTPLKSAVGGVCAIIERIEVSTSKVSTDLSSKIKRS